MAAVDPKATSHVLTERRSAWGLCDDTGSCRQRLQAFLPKSLSDHSPLAVSPVPVSLIP